MLAVTLLGLTMLGSYWSVTKILGLHSIVLPEYIRYSEAEIERLNLARYGFLSAAGMALVAFILLVIQAIRQKKSKGRLVNRKDISVVPAILFVWYIISFSLFYSLNAAFTRIGGTTPYCYDDPFMKIYEPMVNLAYRIGWYGSGNRYALAWLKNGGIDNQESEKADAPDRDSPQFLQ